MRYIIHVFWREAVDDQPSSRWEDVVDFHYEHEGRALVFCTPTGANHRVNVNATQLITIMEK
jgi:hypothetical protein